MKKILLLLVALVSVVSASCTRDSHPTGLRANIVPLRGTTLGWEFRITTDAGTARLRRIGDYFGGLCYLGTPGYTITSSTTGWNQRLFYGYEARNDVAGFNQVDSTTGRVTVATKTHPTIFWGCHDVGGFVEAAHCMADSTIQWQIDDTTGTLTLLNGNGIYTDGGAFSFTQDDPKPQCYP